MKRVIGYTQAKDWEGNPLGPVRPIYEDLGPRILNSFDTQTVTTYKEDRGYIHEGNNYVFRKNRSGGRNPERR